MSAFYCFYPPSGGGSSNASVGTNGVTAPTSSTEVAGVNPSGNLQPLQTNAAGSLITTPDPAGVQHVIVDSSALPTGAATQTTLSTVSTTLGSILLDMTNGTQITQVSNFPATQPVSGTVTVTQATGTNLHTVIDSGTVTANIGTTNGLALDASLTTLNTSVNTLLKPASTLAAVTAITNALPAGTNLLGKVGIDQTTVGTTNAVSLAQIGATTVATGNGVTGAGVQRVTISSDNTAFPVNATLQTGANVVGKVSIDQTTPGTTNLVAANNTQVNGVAMLAGNGVTGTGSQRVTIASDNTPFPTINTGTASATNALTSSASTANVASQVIKASAGRLYSFAGYNSSASAQFIQIFNSATVPADGTAPIYVFTVPAASNWSYDFPLGRYFSTGISVSNSSTQATKTIGTTNCWFNAEYV